MKTITIKAPADLDCDTQEWNAAYVVDGKRDVRLVNIEARSAIEVVVAKIIQENLLFTEESYFIASPNFGVALPGISTLQETFWITEQLMANGMSAPDAVTVAQVLRDMDDF